MQRKLYMILYLKIACQCAYAKGRISGEAWGILKRKNKYVLSSVLQYLSEVIRAYHKTKAKVFNWIYSFSGSEFCETEWQTITAKKNNIESFFSGSFTVFSPSLFLALICPWLLVLSCCFSLENSALSINYLWKTTIYSNVCMGCCCNSFYLIGLEVFQLASLLVYEIFFFSS